jgi:hypothetical protein
MVKFFAHPMLAIVFGAFVLCAETCNHLEDIVHPKTWVDLPIHDWAAGLLLVYSGLLCRRDWPAGRPWQTAGWGFMSSLLIGAFVAHWEDAAPSGVPNGALTAILGCLLIVAVGGLMATLFDRHEP